MQERNSGWDDVALQALAENQNIRVAYAGVSMAPLLRAGDILIVEKVPVDTVSFGDLVVFKDNKRNVLVIHRYIGRRKKGGIEEIITKADNDVAKDDGVLNEFFRGRVIKAERAGRKALIFKGLRCNTVFCMAGILSVCEYAVWRIIQGSLRYCGIKSNKYGLFNKLRRCILLPKAIFIIVATKLLPRTRRTHV